MELGLSGKKVVIVGGSAGIGKACAELFVEEGCKVAVTYNSNKLKAEAFAEKFQNHEIRIFEYNLENIKRLKENTQKIKEEFGDIDILILNAGKNIITPFLNIEEDEWDNIMDINLKGQYFAIKEFVKFINKKDGAITLVSSVAGETGAPHHAHYAAAKAGIINLVKSAARALSPGIRINGIAPGITETEMGIYTIQNLEAGYAQKKLLSHRFASPREIGKMIVFISSPAAGFIYGATIDINGGREMR